MKQKILLGLKVLLFLVFLAAGGAKLVGHERMVHVFELVGVGQWFRVFTGVVEVVAAICLLVPRLSGWAAAALACTMSGAIGAQLLRVHENPIVGVVLLVLTTFVAYESLKPLRLSPAER